MSEQIEFVQLEEAGATNSGPPGIADLRRLSEVPVDLSVEIGRTRMTVGDTLELRPGSIVTLNRMAGEPVDLLVNGTIIAHGEVVVIDEEFALRLTEVVGGQAAALAAPTPGPVPTAIQDRARDGEADPVQQAPLTADGAPA
jgi:flagellar motor switch protein FliN